MSSLYLGRRKKTYSENAPAPSPRTATSTAAPAAAPTAIEARKVLHPLNEKKYSSGESAMNVAVMQKALSIEQAKEAMGMKEKKKPAAKSPAPPFTPRRILAFNESAARTKRNASDSLHRMREGMNSGTGSTNM